MKNSQLIQQRRRITRYKKLKHKLKKTRDFPTPRQNQENYLDFSWQILDWINDGQLSKEGETEFSYIQEESTHSCLSNPGYDLTKLKST
jgi:hypothetical protein